MMDCVKCSLAIEPESSVICTLCNAHFHVGCVTYVGDKIDDCIRCRTKQTNEFDSNDRQAKDDASDGKSARGSKEQSVKSSSKSKRSSKSQKLLMNELKQLDACQKEALDLITQKEQLLNEKIALHKSYQEQRSKILDEIDAKSCSQDGSSVSSKSRASAKVEKWLKSTEVPQCNLQPLPKPVGIDVQPQQLVTATKPIQLSQTQPDYQPTLSKAVIAVRNSDVKKLPNFDGSPKLWPTFIDHYKKSTTMCHYENIDNIFRLRNSLTGRALKAVEGALSHPDNVPYILETLQELFGKPIFIINELKKDVRSFPQLKLDKFGDIIEFALLVNNMTTTMVGAHMSKELWDTSLLEELVMKLPTQMKREWAAFEEAQHEVNLESFNYFMRSKRKECARLITEPPSFAENKIKKGSVHLHEKSNDSKCLNCQGIFSDDSKVEAVNLHENPRGDSKCYLCEKNCSNVSQCEVFKNMSYKDKFGVVKKYYLCRKCLCKHSSPCPRKDNCGIDSCTYKHHPLLHKPADSTTLTHYSKSDGSMFKILPITLHHNGKTFETYALLDDGSSITLIESSVTKSMGINGTPNPLCLKWTSDTHRYEPESQQISMKVSGSDGKLHLIRDLHTVSSLNLPTQTISSTQLKEQFKYLRNVPLPSYENVQPTVLIGLNNTHLTLAQNTKVGHPDEPAAIKTPLGWVVFGSISGSKPVQEVYHICECESQCNSKLEEMVRDYIALDNLNVAQSNSLMSKEDERSLTIMHQTTKLVGQRYETGLLWRFDHFNMPSSYAMACKRLKCLEKQIMKNPNLRDQMQAQIDEYIQLNYARELTTSEIASDQPCWYLPLFVVNNPNKPSKIRLVWDAAATVNGVSLNSFLLKGPDQLVNLCGVLERFRQFKVAIVGDIRHMFHQIKIRKEDQAFLRFLWTDTDGNIKTYVMEVMCFGPSCSPSCAQYVKNLNADKFLDLYPRAVQAIKENHYVDDMLDSVESEEKAKQWMK